MLLVPLSQRDSQLLLANAITHFLPLRQVGEEDFRRITGCHSVPAEGRNPHCDVRTTPQGGGGG